MAGELSLTGCQISEKPTFPPPPLFSSLALRLSPLPCIHSLPLSLILAMQEADLKDGEYYHKQTTPGSIMLP